MTDERLKQLEQIAAVGVTGTDGARIAAAVALEEAVAEIRRLKGILLKIEGAMGAL